jgi:hypothetical protein
MKRFKVIYKNLRKAWGYADLTKKEVIMDRSLNGKKHLEILLHELTHLCLPEATEEEVVRISINITNTLWQQKYRRIDDRNNEPLQDGTK